MNDFEKIKASSRNRIIFPYLRRLFETHKSVCVTRRRIEANVNFAMPDEEIKQAFNQKYNEIYMVRSIEAVDRRTRRDSSTLREKSCEDTASS